MMLEKPRMTAVAVAVVAKIIETLSFRYDQFIK